jgi:tRNA-binding protein
MKSSAQVTKLYSKADLLGRQIIGVINLPPKQIGTFMSHFLVTGFILENGEVVLAQPQQSVPNGSRLA